jgi:recombinational DNA repair ATPase RecF
MLDDLSSELDKEHLIKVLRAGLALGVQVWITGTSLSPTITNNLEVTTTGFAMFHVEHGKISQVKP